MEQSAGRFDDLSNGQMKEVTFGETPVLLVRLDDECHAYHGRCTHYGAPLAEGMLSDGRIICPWHNACFEARTGRMLVPPALDSLARYDVRVDAGMVLVDLPEAPPDRHVPPEVRRDSKSTATIAIVGGGAAAAMGAQALREMGCRDRIVMYTPEDRLPYDRPNLSKDYLQGHADPAWMPLRDEAFYAERDIEIVTGRRVTLLDADTRTITLDDDTIHEYTDVLLATGSAPRRLDVPGSDLENVFVLRSFDDADAIIAASGSSRRAVMIGASFIAMEAAASLRTRGLDVTIVAPDAVPFERTLGGEIGGLFRSTHEDNGVRFRLGASVERFEGSGSVERVILSGNESIDADLVVVGIGVRPVTGYLRGVELDEHGGVLVDAGMRARDHVFAAGDIAAFLDRRTGERMRIEHWRSALHTAREAARTMLGVTERVDAVPFFWTTQFDLTLNYVGHTIGWDEIETDGSVARRDFLARYVRSGRVVAAAAVGRERELIGVEEEMRAGRV